MARNMGLLVLSVTLGILFIAAGTMKLSPSISAEIYKEAKTRFKKAAKVFPLYKVLGWRPKPSQYRRAYGTAEVVCGLVLLFIPGRIKTLANIILLVTCMNALYTHLYALGEEAKDNIGGVIVTILLIGRFILDLQSSSEGDVYHRSARQKSD